MSFCPGSRVSGSIPMKAAECVQRIRGRIVDTELGETIATLAETEVSEGESLDFDFSFEMPWRTVPLKAVIERKVGENWVVVDTKELSVDLLEPRATIGSLSVPDRKCAGYSIEASIGVTAEECSQRIRSRLVDEETGEAVKSWITKELGAGEEATFEFPFEMPWRNIPLRAEVERFDPATEAWDSIGANRKEIEQKEPAIGEVIGREVAGYARPGYSTSGSVTAENAGECEGDIRIEGFLAGSRVTRNDYTLAPGDSKTPTYAATMPPTMKANVNFSVLSQREEEMEETFSTLDSIVAARAVILDEGAVSVHGGEEPFPYSGVIIARNVEWEGPDVTEEEAPISPLRPLKGEVRPYVFTGRVGAEEIDNILFEPGSLVYLRTVTGVGNSWCIFGDLRSKDTKEMTYSAVEMPLVIARSKLAALSSKEIAEMSNVWG